MELTLSSAKSVLFFFFYTSHFFFFFQRENTFLGHGLKLKIFKDLFIQMNGKIKIRLSVLIILLLRGRSSVKVLLKGHFSCLIMKIQAIARQRNKLH